MIPTELGRDEKLIVLSTTMPYTSSKATKEIINAQGAWHIMFKPRSGGRRNVAQGDHADNGVS